MSLLHRIETAPSTTEYDCVVVKPEIEADQDSEALVFKRSFR